MLKTVEQHLLDFTSLRTSFSQMGFGMVLDALSMSPFKPLVKIDFRILSFKMALLLALASVKRVSEIHALLVHSYSGVERAYPSLNAIREPELHR